MESGHVYRAINRGASFLWRLLTWWRTLEVLLLCLALLLIFGGVRPLFAGETMVDPASISVLQPEASAAISVANAGVTPGDSWWIRLFLAFVGSVCAARLIETLVPARSLPPLGRSKRDRIVWSNSNVDVVSRIAERLSAQGLRVDCPGNEGSARRLVAWRDGMGRWLRGLLYAGVLLLLAGSVVQQRLGYVGEPVDLLLGVPTSLGPEGSLQVTLRQIEVLGDGEGGVVIHRSEIVAQRDGEGDEQAWLYPGRAASVGGLSLYQVRSGPAMRVTAYDGQGRALNLQDPGTNVQGPGTLHIGFSGTQQERIVHVPGARLIVSLVYYPSLPAEGIDSPVVHVQVQSATDGRMLTDRFYTENGEVVADGVRLGFVFEYSVGVRPEREPELPLYALGAVAVVLGVLAHALWPESRVWLSTDDEGPNTVVEMVRCGSSPDGQVSFEALMSEIDRAED